ncbi:MAG: hypothetical protein KGN30_12915, partial [Nitrospirota bacterium]|nr:hypothetical protein [Nitrospirota bacterium]
MGKGGKRTRLTFPVTVTETHRGKALEVDCAQETIVLRDPDGNPLGSVTWHAVIEHIYAAAAQRPPEQMRVQPRASLVAQVRYWTTGDQPTDSRATGIGGGGLFIESLTPLPVGTNLDLEFVLPGILMMNIINAAFLQASTAVYFSRFIKFVEEMLVAPLSYVEMIIGSVSVVVAR